MSSIQDLLKTLADEPVIFSAVVFVAVFTAALAFGWRFLRPTPEVPRRPASAADLERGTEEPPLLNERVLETSVGFEGRRTVQLGGSGPDPLLRAKHVFRKVFRVLAGLIVATLLTLTVLAYRDSTPGTGDVLLSIVLAVVTLLAAARLLEIDRRHDREPDPALKAALHEAIQGDLSGKIQEALSGGVKVKWNVSSPEVHRIDEDGLALARSMADKGKSIDDICRAMDSDYASWSPPHQQAFRNVMQAALDHG
jgi:hypothetical protein